jgi:hypothetical protein
MAERTPSDIELDLISIRVDPADPKSCPFFSRAVYQLPLAVVWPHRPW